MHLGDVGGGGDLAGADRPDRLVGDDQLALLPIVGERAGELRRRPRATWPPAARSASDLADADDGDEAAASAPPRPWRGPSASLSCCSARRSLWPTMTSRAPASLIIADRDAAGMGAALRRVAILARRSTRPPERVTAGAIRVKGGQIATSTPPAARAASAIGASSASCGEAAVHLPIAGDELAAEVHRAFPARRWPSRHGCAAA